jgi:hypothetical protein
MEKIVKLTESDLNRIVKKIINENHVSLDRVRDDLRFISLKLLRSMDEYSMLSRKGEYKRMSDELDNVRLLTKRLKDVIQKIESNT